MAEIASDRAVDPDAQAAVTDFLDYTEYFPSDLIRSLTLIRGLDQTYLNNSDVLHDLTKLYGSLPKIAQNTRPDAQQLRSQISTHLDHALNARESAYAEACRLFEVADRHQNRLKSIIAKLHAIPKPPSRDPTPQPSSSAQSKRARNGRKIEVGTTTQRLTLNLPRSNAVASAVLHRPRGRRVTVPGEVLPPFDPDSPILSTETSDSESSSASPARPILSLKPPKLPKDNSERLDKTRQHREQSIPYRKPTPPPEDAQIGSKYKPWTRLTEYEMYKLRKKMKKNHSWEPSDGMIKRELADRGRGLDNYYKAKAEAKANGTKFYEIEGNEKSQSHARPSLEKRESSSKSFSTPAPKPKVTKNLDSKKEKREDVAREQALAAQEAELAARRLGNIGSAFKNLFSPVTNALSSLNRSTSTPNIAGRSTSKKSVPDTILKKRKNDEIATSASPSAETDQQRKKQKTVPRPSPLASSEPPAQSAGTIKIPLKLNVSSRQSLEPSTVSTPISESHASTTQSSVTPKTESATPEPSRQPSHHSTAASADASTVVITTRPSRRTSTTPGLANGKVLTTTMDTTPKATTTAASRRSKRDAPGTVTQSSQDGGAAVSISKRKTKPTKHSKITQAPKATATDTAALPQIRIDVDGKQEIVDPDEERYCICGDVSWGEMICCEMDEKCEYGQWFHMECVSLAELPPRTVKWYCPGDRKKLRRGENSNGLVGRGIK